MNKLVEAWYQGSPWLSLLKPLSTLFRWQAEKRRNAYLSGKKSSWRASVPVIVVGNISVGGVGKTPLVAWLAQILQEAGYKPGIVSRGYGSRAPRYPFDVSPDTNVIECGDEPMLLAQNTRCPVVIDADRVAAVKFLLKHHACDLIISDDGMQHYALARDLEIAVIDGSRGLGNSLCLPAGPLREPPSRLQEVDFILVNGEGFVPVQPHYRMSIVPGQLQNLVSKSSLPGNALATQAPVHGVAGIGNPSRFFATLRSMGYQVMEHEFPHHHQFRAKDLSFNDGLAVIITEKDAVKCAAIAHDQCWCLRVSAELPALFKNALIDRISVLSAHPKTNV